MDNMENIISRQYRYQHNQAKPRQRKIGKSGNYQDYLRECDEIRKHPQWTPMIKEMKIEKLAQDYGFSEPNKVAQWDNIL